MVTAFCRTTLHYMDARTVGQRVPIDIEVLDGRTAELPGWNLCGFELVHHESAVTDWGDDTLIAAVHHPELEQLARTLTGCDHATVTSHIKRGPARPADTPTWRRSSSSTPTSPPATRP